MSSESSFGAEGPVPLQSGLPAKVPYLHGLKIDDQWEECQDSAAVEVAYQNFLCDSNPQDGSSRLEVARRGFEYVMAACTSTAMSSTPASVYCGQLLRSYTAFCTLHVRPEPGAAIQMTLSE